MRRILIFVGIVVVIILAFRFCEFKKGDSATIEYDTNLIQERIVNVGKLIVTEGHFAEVLTYKDQDKYLMDLISFEKKALVIVNAEVTVAYDLRQMKYDIDEKDKTITITYIPKEEIKINPDIKFYDVNQSRMNPFTGDDYNKISKSVKANLAKKIEKSTLKTNAQNRLISELSKILITTNSMGWTLRYDGKTINEESIDKVLL
ncbi:lipopolysaccharide export LptBFGC system permease protein LptF [Flavobacterium gossypii]|uniref:Lipopolysaccharide export LptBFGC system permease protein LptF n=1 Tax=Flavobacterium gossypii TaxID=1646119 RepID=A0ABR6DLY5_9FLAO|nr:lipopolysaccharide export LptBFGC system permease protein LptF [Flavobacterium gossypii]